jgi:glycine cleavage system regulatory protein
MSVQIMVTVSGSNQTDLVKILSEKTHALGGQWLNSKISHIDEYFAGLIKVEIASEQVEKLIDGFKELAINVEAVVIDPAVQKTLTHLDLNIDAKDRPGLVHDISQVLGENSIRVENMECHRLGLADISGTVFTSRFKIAVAENFNKEALINSLQEISSDLVIELHGQS